MIEMTHDGCVFVAAGLSIFGASGAPLSENAIGDFAQAGGALWRENLRHDQTTLFIPLLAPVIHADSLHGRVQDIRWETRTEWSALTKEWMNGLRGKRRVAQARSTLDGWLYPKNGFLNDARNAVGALPVSCRKMRLKW